MRNVIIASLFASGLLFAASSTPDHLSYNERLALETQAPRVHVDKHYNKNGNVNSEDKITTNRTTVVAHIPYGQR